MTLPFRSILRSQQSGENWWTQQASKRIPRHKALHCLARTRSHKQDSCQTLQWKGSSSRKGDHPPWWNPVFRLSAMAKIFTSIINNRLCDYLIEKGIITQQQCGFRKKHGTQDSIFILKAVIDKYVKSKPKKSNNLLFTCFVDYSNAFDSIPRGKLFQKFRLAGVTGRFLEILHSMYSPMINHLWKWKLC